MCFLRVDHSRIVLDDMRAEVWKHSKHTRTDRQRTAEVVRDWGVQWKDGKTFSWLKTLVKWFFSVILDLYTGVTQALWFCAQRRGSIADDAAGNAPRGMCDNRNVSRNRWDSKHTFIYPLGLKHVFFFLFFPSDHYSPTAHPGDGSRYQIYRS